jgi:hypothetical protein
MMRRFVVLEPNPADAHISALKVDDGVHARLSDVVVEEPRPCLPLSRNDSCGGPTPSSKTAKEPNRDTCDSGHDDRDHCDAPRRACGESAPPNEEGIRRKLF